MFHVTKEFLRIHPNCVFVFGDNLLHYGKKGAAILRDEPNTLGFITKKAPNNRDCSFYKPDDYLPLFEVMLQSLRKHIIDNQNKLYLISKLGSGLANRYRIWEEVIRDGLEPLRVFPNVIFLFEEGDVEQRIEFFFHGEAEREQ